MRSPYITWKYLHLLSTEVQFPLHVHDKNYIVVFVQCNAKIRLICLLNCTQVINYHKANFQNYRSSILQKN